MIWLRRVLNLWLPCLIAAAPTPVPALAQNQPNAEPVLRLETGMHTAPIKGAASDAAGRILATPPTTRLRGCGRSIPAS
jgi:hypothetical protein